MSEGFGVIGRWGEFGWGAGYQVPGLAAKQAHGRGHLGVWAGTVPVHQKGLVE